MLRPNRPLKNLEGGKHRFPSDPAVDAEPRWEVPFPVPPPPLHAMRSPESRFPRSSQALVQGPGDRAPSASPGVATHRALRRQTPPHHLPPRSRLQGSGDRPPQGPTHTPRGDDLGRMRGDVSRQLISPNPSAFQSSEGSAPPASVDRSGRWSDIVKIQTIGALSSHVSVAFRRRDVSLVSLPKKPRKRSPHVRQRLRSRVVGEPWTSLA